MLKSHIRQLTPKLLLSSRTFIVLILSTVPLLAHADEESNIDALFKMDLEQLMQVRISVSDRSEETLERSAAAVSILSAEDIKLSGIRTIPELLRLIPGFNVRRIDANKWAINSRRIPQRFSGSMLVLKDGRTLYNPLFAGTYWDLPDNLLSDLKHIEVIRGPGSSAWGANAITGVINIVTKSAHDTTGGLAVIGAGSGEIKQELAARYGQPVKDSAIRFFGKARETAQGYYLDSDYTNSETFFDNKSGAGDGIESTQFGFRYDSATTAETQHSLQGEWDKSDSDEVRSIFGTTVADNHVETEGYYLLYNSKYRYSNSGSLNWLAYYDYSDRASDIFDEERKISHIEVNNHSRIKSHELSAGLFARNIKDKTESNGTFTLNPRSSDKDFYSVFLQHKWQPEANSFTFIWGLRYEHNEETDWEYNPTIRIIYQPSNLTYWGAWTRSVRTPSRSNTDAELNFDGFVVPLASQNLKAVVTHSYEFGLRYSMAANQSIEASLFLDRERDPLVDSSGASIRRSRYKGIEIEYSYRPVSKWQFIYSFSYLNSREGEFEGTESIEKSVWSNKARSLYKLSSRLSWNTILIYEDGLPTGLTEDDFPDLKRLDTNVLWQAADNIEIQFSLQNLLDEYHVESSDPTKINTAVKRGGEILARINF